MNNDEISYRKQRPDLFFRDGRPKKKLCFVKRNHINEKLINVFGLTNKQVLEVEKNGGLTNADIETE